MVDHISGHLRFVASLFRYLPGLVIVPNSAWFLFCSVTRLDPIPGLLLLVPCNYLARRLKTYYERKLGVPDDRGWVLVVGLCFLGGALDRFFHQDAFIWMVAAYFLLSFACSFRRRWYCLLPALWFIALAAAGHSSMMQVGQLFAASVIFVSILDHFQLTRSPGPSSITPT